MFLSSKSLPWLLPQLILSARPGTEVALVSAWISDIPLDLPNPLRNSGAFLSTLIRFGQDTLGLRFIVYCRENDLHLKKIQNKLSKPLDVRLRPNVHAKVYITKSLILSGSSNILYKSAYVNEENLQLNVNTWQNVARAVKETTGLS